MKILLMNQFFWPDSAATGQLLTDLARDLGARGHEVHVICGGSYAPSVADGPPPAEIHRVRGIGFSRGKLSRLASYLSFYVGAAWRALTMPRPDVVLTLTTPPLLSIIGALMHRLRGVRFFLWEMDVYPDVALDLGYVRTGSLLHRITGTLADWSRTHAAGIIALGECMRARLVARGIDTRKITTIHNWADGKLIEFQPRRPADLNVQVVYSGNLGLAHDVATISSAILQLRDDPRFQFTFLGGGSRREELAAFIKEHSIEAVSMRSHVPRANLGETLGSGDIGLVTQRDDCCGSVVPSKVYGLMAAGRPILFIGPAAATPAHIISTHACGWHVPCGDAAAVVKLLTHLVNHPEEITAAGQNGRRALEMYYDRSLGTASFIALLTGQTDSTLLSTSPSEKKAPIARSVPS